MDLARLPEEDLIVPMQVEEAKGDTKKARKDSSQMTFENTNMADVFDKNIDYRGNAYDTVRRNSKME